MRRDWPRECREAEERVRIYPSKVEIFKWLLRNGVSKANVDRNKRNREKKGKSQRTDPCRMEILRW